MCEHPSLTLLERFARGDAAADERQEVVRHLLRGCAACASQVRDALALDPAAGAPASEGGCEDAAELLQALNALPLERQLAAAEHMPRFRHAGLCHLLIAAAEKRIHADPAAMLHETHLAVLIADGLEGEDPHLADLRGEAWSYRGNALRILGRFRDAEMAFRRAAGLLAAGTGDSRLKARLLRHSSTLYSNQGRLQEAIAGAAEAAKIYRSLDERENVARCLVKQAIFTGYAGHAEEALGLIFQALLFIDRDAELAWQAVHAAARFSIDLGLPQMGLLLLEDNRELLEADNRPLVLLRRVWLQGELAHALKRYPEAERCLAKARQGLVAREMPFEAGIVTLELAAVYGETGRMLELRRAVAETLPIFRSLRLRQQTLASLRMLQHAELEIAAPVLERATAELRRLAQSPGTHSPGRPATTGPRVSSRRQRNPRSS